MSAILFKILQRRLRFRNPNHHVKIPEGFAWSSDEYKQAAQYIEQLSSKGLAYTFPGDANYPRQFVSMKEPPLFLEYRGEAFWNYQSKGFISVIGSRSMSPLTDSWMRLQLPSFLEQADVGLVSGGARGVDQLAHFLSIKVGRPTVCVLPSGLLEVYPENLRELERGNLSKHICFVSEFESHQVVHKSHFYFRNRLIAALGAFTLVTQASLKSGSLLTIHHCLENGRPVLVIPSHPEVIGFEGNLKLLREGAFPIANKQDMLDFWNAEFQTTLEFNFQ